MKLFKLAGVLALCCVSSWALAADDWPIIKRKVDLIYENDKEFRFLGMAAPNIQQNESQILPDFSNRFPDEYEIRDVLGGLQRVGSRATRSFSFSVFSSKDKGIPVYIEGRRKYNEEAFKSFDLLLALCKEYDIRILVPLIASQSFPTIRGVDEFAALSGKTAVGAFWTDETVKDDFKHFIKYLMNRKNTITGIRYKDDPAILAWQMGNEFDSFYNDRKLKPEEWKPIITQWQSEMAAYMKKQDPNHMIMEAGGDRTVMLNDKNIDLMSSHLYEYWNRLSGASTDLAALAKAEKDFSRGKKALMIDEFGLGTYENVSALIEMIKKENISGGLLWSIRGHNRNGGFYYHNEGGTYVNSYHVPGFATGFSYDETRLLDLIRYQGYIMRNEAAPAVQPPALTPVLRVHKGGLIWRGSTGASGYTIERAESAAGPWVVAANNVVDSVIFDVKTYEAEGKYDHGPLWYEESVPKTKKWFYRVKGSNIAGETPYSNLVEM
jgi:mannan endo-1,4-beta-mannosidase